MRTYLLYNLKAGHKTAKEDVLGLEKELQGDCVFTEISEIKDYSTFFATLMEDDIIVLCGGDGTLNRFVNNTEGIDYKNEIYYYPLGTGNDFATELGYQRGCKPFAITKYLKDLPKVTVNGKTSRFLNGVGFGIDGYCCEVGDKLKLTSDKPVNYTAIAIKGLLYAFKPVTAKVVVDGKEYTYKKTWIAPTMNGKYYGGGMKACPDQDRLSEDGKVSLMMFHGSGKLKTLMVFPSIFKGEHVKHTEMVTVLTGNEIYVEFDRPCALQIDGETVLGVTSYRVESKPRITAGKKKEEITV